MSLEDFEKFRQLVFADRSLQRELYEIEQPDRFAERVKQLAAERLLTVADEDIQEATRQARKEWIERWI
jgi:hypothetical protein